MSRRTQYIKKLRNQQSDLTRILPRRATTTGVMPCRVDGKIVPGKNTGAVGTLPAKDSTVARWAKFWK